MPAATDSGRLGPYKLASLLGSGGMGKVYRARDTRLNRDVAIKIVSGDVQEEARAVSALNHPNILTIHDVGVEDGTSYIVSELVDGRSLREVLSEGALTMRKVLDYGVQIADGLAAAHEAGIVHRDLKPENIMITRDDRVKILDFGIAKVVEPLSDTARTLGRNTTEQGLLIGTTTYMSPEQARGARVTCFADQFALGLILYEMASGEAPFKRDNPLQTLSAILTEDAPPLEAGSAPFQWLVKRCLHKEPDHRYASTTDLFRELQNIRAALTEEVIVPESITIQRPPRSGRWMWIPAAVLAGIGIGFMAARLAGSRTDGGLPAFTPFASSAAMEVFPAWAPNGRSIAYSAAIDGIFQIFVQARDAIDPTQITAQPEDALRPFWSPDGARIYFLSRGALWGVSATGGTPELVLTEVVQADVARDGTTFALIRPNSASAGYDLWLGPLGRLRRIEERSLQPWSQLRFSPDGKRLAAWLALASRQSELWLYPADGGNPEQALKNLPRSSWTAREFSWMPDSRHVVFSDASGLSVGSHLSIVDLSTGNIERLTQGTGGEFSPSISPDGKSLAFASQHLDYDLVRVDWSGQIADVLATPRIEFSPAMTRTGDLVYVTDRSGRPEIWLQRREEERARPVIKPDDFSNGHTLLLAEPVISPDGRRVAYTRSGSDGEAIWISTLNGGSPVPLVSEDAGVSQCSPTWSPDGNWIAYTSIRDGTPVLMRARVGGQERPVRLAENAGADPRWSPRGGWIATARPEGGILLVKEDGSARRDEGSGVWLVHGWSADGGSLYGVKCADGGTLQLVNLRLNDGSESVVANLGRLPAAFTYGSSVGAPAIRGFSLTPDGGGFLSSTLRSNSDLWLLDRPGR